MANLIDLIGCRIDHARQSKLHGDLVIYFIMNDGRIARIFSEGECCAHAYIQHINNPDIFTVADVLNIENLELVYTGDDDKIVDTWGHTITTNHGSCTLECRTEHNGWYSGWLNLDWIEKLPEGTTELIEC